MIVSPALLWPLLYDNTLHYVGEPPLLCPHDATGLGASDDGEPPPAGMATQQAKGFSEMVK